MENNPPPDENALHTFREELTRLVPTECLDCPNIAVRMQSASREFRQTDEQQREQIRRHGRQLISSQVEGCPGLIYPPAEIRPGFAPPIASPRPRCPQDEKRFRS